MKKTLDKSKRECQDVILDSINEGVFTVGLDWRISSFNRAAEIITGVSREKAVGHACYEVFRTNICEDSCALKKTMSTGEPIVNATAHIVTESGIRVPIRVSTALLKDDHGVVIGGVETFQDLTQVERLRKELEARYTFEDVIGRSQAMTELFQILPQIAESDSTVLIEGGSGTGKELFARALHNLSPRKKKRFVPVNCAALPDTLLESELFGYKAGAFTDAKKDKPGRFALADGGTIFLDEIGDVSPAMQARLLRVLQDQKIEPLGSVEPIQVNARVVCATNKDLTRLARSGKFREDLYYRVRVIHLKLPCLKRRREDIPLLVDHLIGKFNLLQDKDIAGVSGAVMARLMEHDFPGNVRELENVIERAFALCRGNMIEMHHLPADLRPDEVKMGEHGSATTLDSMEKIMITEALRRCQGNKKQAARELGVNASTIYRKIKALGIEPPERRRETLKK